MSYMKPSELKDYEIMCKVKGNLPRREYEDGMLNDAILRAFEDADFGCLFDTDLTDEIWEAEGKCTFIVPAYSKGEAMDKAEDVLFKLYDEGRLNFGDLEDIYCDEIDKKRDFICLNEFPHIKFDKDFMYSDKAVKSPLVMLDLQCGVDTDKYIYTTQVGTINGTSEENNGVYFDWSLLYDKENKTITFAPVQPESRCFSPACPKGYLMTVPDDIIKYAQELSFKELAERKNFDLSRWEKTDNGYAGKYLSLIIDLTDEDLQTLGVKDIVDSCENKDKCKEIARNAIKSCIEEYGKSERNKVKEMVERE